MDDASSHLLTGGNAQLLSIQRYIGREASPALAKEFTNAIVTHCEQLATLPHRGTRRDEIKPGLRTIGFRRRVTIAFAVDDEAVMIVGVFYGGQDYTGGLTKDEDGAYRSMIALAPTLSSGRAA